MPSPEPRGDLVDDGIFRPTRGEAPGRPRREPTLLTGGDLDAPSRPRPAAADFDSRGRPTGEPAEAVARRETRDGRHAHFAKVGTSGRERGKLYDPRSTFGNGTELTAGVRRVGRAKYEIAAVSRAVFDDYLAYLQGGDSGLLRRAQRNHRDG